jgi:hypothetical protein
VVSGQHHFYGANRLHYLSKSIFAAGGAYVAGGADIAVYVVATAPI